MRIVAFGAGGVGGFFGGKLALSGEDVTFVARGAHFQAIRDKGLRIATPEGDLLVKPASVTDDVSTLAPPDYLLFAVKLYDTEKTAELCRPIVGPNTTVVSLQNGVEAVDILNGVFGKDRVLGGMVGVATYISEPGVVSQTGTFHFMAIGEQDGSRSKRAVALYDACRRAGINIKLSDDIDVDIWLKFIFLSALSSVTALTRLPNGPLRTTPETRDLFRTCMEEAAAVGRAKGVNLPPDVVDDRMKMWDGMPAEMVASMAHDLNAGKPIEMARLGGAVVRLGHELGIPTPTQAVLCAALTPYLGGAPT
jgi:2-dehydropantoate 2-reductase